MVRKRPANRAKRTADKSPKTRTSSPTAGETPRTAPCAGDSGPILPSEHRSSTAVRHMRNALTDRRTREAKEYADTLGTLIQDLGGEQDITRAQALLARRAAALSVLLDRIEGALLTGGKGPVPSFEDVTRLTNSLRQVLVALGLERKPRQLKTIDPLAFADQFRQARAEAEDTEVLEGEPA